MRFLDLVAKHGDKALALMPRLPGQLVTPNTNVWFVDANSPNALDANDGAHGDSWDMPFASLSYAIARNNGSHTGYAITNVVDWSASPWWKTNNVIVVAPGEYAALTTLPYACTVVGLGGGWGTEGSVQIKSTTGSAAAGSLIGAALLNLHFETEHASPVLALSTFNSSFIKDCVFHNGGAATYGVSIKTSTRGRISDCIFGTGNVALTHGIYIGGGATDKKAFGMVIERNLIDAGTAGIYCAAEYLTGCTWVVGNKIAYPAKGIDIDTTTPLWRIMDNDISASSDCIEGAQAFLTTGNRVNLAGVGTIEAASA